MVQLLAKWWPILLPYLALAVLGFPLSACMGSEPDPWTVKGSIPFAGEMVYQR